MAKKDGDDRIVFVLETPVEWHGETITEITYRRPKGRDLRRMTNIAAGAKGKAGDGMVKMMSDLCEQPEGFFDEMDGADWVRLSEEVSGFFEDVR